MVLLVLEPLVAADEVPELVFVPVLLVAAHHPVQPADLLGQRGVDPGHVLLPATHSEGHDAHLGVGGVGGVSGVLGADQGAAPVTFAGVLARYTSGTDEGGVQSEPLAQPGGPELLLADVVPHHGDLQLLQDHLVLTLSTVLVLPPPGGEAGPAVEVLPGLGEADGVHVVVQHEVLSREQHREVVSEAPPVELRVDGEAGDVPVLVREGLRGGLSVPLATPHYQLARAGPEVLQLQLQLRYLKYLNYDI